LNGTDRSWSVCLDLAWGRVAPKRPAWGDGCPFPQAPPGKEVLQGRRSVAARLSSPNVFALPGF